MLTLRRGLIVLVLCLVAIALYRGWVSFSRPSPDPQGNKVDVNLSVDKSKIKADVAKVEEKVEEKVSEGISRVKQLKNGSTAPATK